MKRLILLLTPVLLAACASSPASKEVPLATIDKGTVCEREAGTGTNLPTKRCRTAEQRAANQNTVNEIEEARARSVTMPMGK
jgi:hypothetical protein